ncbi:MAG TPA: D-Ala-D-Ala carboxypeptidase family metallohydrolase [bacterium]|nr:D-Ala-D-Ala carboxypeptidase family metallohydrolase [bacterium]
MMKRTILRTACLIFLLALLSPAARAFSPGTAGFTLHYKKEVTSFAWSPLFILPGDEISLRIEENATHHLFAVQIDSGALRFKGLNTWLYTAPAAPGFHQGRIICLDRPDTMHLQIFVMAPRSAMKGESIDGYLIGHYPAVALRDLDVYRPPEGFIRVTEADLERRLTPHFTLGQFVCKQHAAFPKYLVLQERLLYKLEYLLQKANEKGYACETFAVMSGYRTPAYNRRIGNRKYSQHCYGGAADIYIDVDLDQIMDDLNKDGRRDYVDAGVLFQVAEWVSRAEWFAPYIGGLARYRANRHHGPFIHVDVRGFSARWGD